MSLFEQNVSSNIDRFTRSKKNYNPKGVVYPFLGGELYRLTVLRLSDNAQPFADAVQDVHE